MIGDFSCPVCGKKDWVTGGSRLYSKDAPDQDPSIRIRQGILLDLWFRGANSALLTGLYCRSCGFICYTPRPEEEDISSKYSLLKKEEDIGGQFGELSLVFDKIRAEKIYGLITNYTDKQNLRVLDFGGGNGKLMYPFMKAGHFCFIIDYSDSTLPGIKKIGDTIKDFSEKDMFDIILCSHVLEHMVEPNDVLTCLLSHLGKGGVIFAEVPVGAKNPFTDGKFSYTPTIDPVTHINFFTLDSFKRLFLKRGLSLAYSSKEKSTYDMWELDVLRVLCKKE